jgi:hypothetical protein
MVYWTLVEGHMAVLYVSEDEARALMTRFPDDPDCRLEQGPVPVERLVENGGALVRVFEDVQEFVDGWLYPDLA